MHAIFSMETGEKTKQQQQQQQQNAHPKHRRAVWKVEFRGNREA